MTNQSESTPAFLLIHSPLVGALTWEPVRALLEARGFRALAPSLVDVMGGEPPYFPRLVSKIAGAANAFGAGDRPLLVAHSGAGALLPAAAAATGTAAGVVYVDATLPRHGQSWFETAPAGLARQLRELAREGRLPPWDQWFPPGTFERLLPEEALRERFRQELPALHLAYFDEPAPIAPAEGAPCAYLQLSAGYREAADEAEALEWPTVRVEAHHLAMLTHPEMVAEHLVTLAARMRAR